MAFESPGWANSGGSATYTAEQTRRAVFSSYARTAANTPGIISGGLLSTADLQLTAPGSGLSVNVGTGECIVGGSEGGVQGGYYARNAATVNLSISAANPSNPRIDTVCVTISDSSYTEPTGGSGNQVAAQVVTGTPTSGATLTNLSGAAALPASSLLLGYVLVPAAASNIITVDIANKAAPVQLSPSFLSPSLVGTWTAPTLLNSWANAGGGGATAGYIKDVLGFVHLRGRISGGANSTVAFALPAGFRPGSVDFYPAGGYDGTRAVAGLIQIDTAGNVTVLFASTATQVGLGGITLLAEN